MYYSTPPMSAADKRLDVEEDNEGTSIQDQDLVETSDGALILDNLEPEDTASTQPRRRSRAISNSDESDDPDVDVQGSAAAPLPIAPLRTAPPLPKRPRTNFGFDLDVSS